ncbi:MAG: ABC transporter ATP-binding protein [Anaerolineae bacterium]|nr:MAG: ABC transporter ATP-binding protein [Anaerolineae bacterium]
MADPILRATGLSKRFGSQQAVKQVSFDIQPGEIFSLLGPNGAGKTTTISMLSGLLIPTEGDALIAGHSVTRQAAAVKQAIGVVPQEIALYPSISARENLAFWGRMYGLGGAHLKERIAATLEVAGLADRADDLVETFSGGMKRRINIAVGLLHQPQILFMDEPTVGNDPQSRRRILDTVKDLNRHGLAVLYTTHYMEEAEELSHRIGIIDNGELIALGTQAELTRTVGEFDTLHITVDREGDALDALCRHMEGVGEVSHCTTDNGGLLLQVKDANAALAGVVAGIAAQGARIRDIDIREPNLEAVFLHLTGRALRD